MKFARSGLRNYPGDSSIYPVKGMDHTKVYPFTVSLPCYASWREYSEHFSINRSPARIAEQQLMSFQSLSSRKYISCRMARL